MAPSPRSVAELLTMGQTIGSYRVVQRIGAGGMGAVYEAVHTTLGRRAAIKVLFPDRTQDPLAAARFFNEARAVNLLQHPSIVQVYEHGQTPDGSAYLVMELLTGETLRERLRRHPGGLGAASLHITRQLATALAACHAKGIVHRDLV